MSVARRIPSRIGSITSFERTIPYGSDAMDEQVPVLVDARGVARVHDSRSVELLDDSRPGQLGAGAERIAVVDGAIDVVAALREIHRALVARCGLSAFFEPLQ